MRNDNFKNFKNFIKNGVDENNIEQFYLLFPQNNKTKDIFEKYKKLKKEIENSSGGNLRKKLIPIKSISNLETNENYYRTSTNFRSRGTKMKKYLIESKSKDNIKKYANNINNNDEKNKIINFCATINFKSNDHFENEKEKDNNFKNNTNDIEDNKVINKNKNENEFISGNKDNKIDKKKFVEEQKKVLYETEIEEKINKYRKERYQPLIEMLEKEKINEFYRNKNLKNIKNENSKKELENIYGKERTLVSLRLNKEHEKIKLDIKNYEKQIREEDQKNHRYNMNLINK